MTALIIACIYGGVSLANSLNDQYNNKNLKLIMDETSESEGFCLTDYVSQLSYSGIQSLYKDACVSIQVNSISGSWLGSGVCVASKGYSMNESFVLEGGSYIVTNYHVIETYYDYIGTEITVYPNEYSNSERFGVQLSYSAELLWSDSYLDLAIIYVEQNIDWVQMKDRSVEGSDKLRQNENAFVIGTPQSLSYQNTITRGTIASTELTYSYTVERLYFTEVMSNIYEDVIPIQISIMGGNSGGGLFDSSGYLVGLPTLGTQNSQSSSAVNYAVPIYPITVVIDEIIASNEDDQRAQITSLDDLDFVVIDSKESSIMIREFDAKNVYFYGSYYSRTTTLNFSDEGLKIIKAGTLSELSEGEIIKSAQFNEKSYNLSSRNDLIYLLLKCKTGDMLRFQLNDDTFKEVIL